MTTFFGILTKIGEAKEARAKALALPVVITEMEVGDGGSDTPPLPDREQVTVIGSKRRAPINRSFPDTNNASWVVFEQVIPEQVGGWWIRQLGLRDADGDLIAVANCPPTYKPQLAEGSARTQVVRFVLQVSSAKDFELKVDPSVVLAARQYVDDGLLQKLDKNGTAVAAAKLATARNIALTGDGSASVSFDGTKNVSGSFTLAASGVSAGSYGSASSIATFEVDAKGRLIAAGSVAVGNAATATKLATARSFSITGGATAAAVNFDGSGNVTLNVTALDVSKATLGILPVARGGMGVGTVAAGSYLIGNGTSALAAKTPAQVLEDIAALPKAGGTVGGPILLGAGAAIGSQYGANSTSAQVAHVVLPDGGGYSVHLASVVGAMKITLPPAAVGANTMIRLRVDIFEYLTDVPPVSVLIHGYVQSSKAWVRHGATIIAGIAESDLQVRFGSDSTGALCIWLGELNKNWSYPSVTVSEVMAKYNANGASVAAWGSGWKVEPVTTFDTVVQTAAISNLAFARSDIARVSGLQAALDSRVPVVSLSSLPTSNIGPVLVAEVAEVWVWTATAFFTGYRSPLCGRPLDGHTVAPLASEVDAVGGILQKSAYAALWGYAQENGLVLTQANWEARRGGHYFVDIDSTRFRVPDLRDMFRRFTGTDADTANAR
ncbi:phage tail protein, partial [Achromobacter mucicolens]|uniref:phage tail protein n=1 Tax=Achromobacter mucicolens TaxID=1389922 RepID=UPI002FE3C809